jgi:tetratricopeptide (TPR) repeat protein
MIINGLTGDTGKPEQKIGPMPTFKEIYSAGLERFNSGDFKEAEKLALRARDMNSSKESANILLGRIFAARKRYSEAEFAFKEALLEKPKSIDAWTGLGEVHLQKEELFRAEDCFKAALEIQPKNAKAQSSLGIVYQNQGEIERAKMYFRSAVENGFETARFNLGTILSEQKRFEEAEEVIKPLIENEEFRAEAILQTGYILLMKGNFDDSLHYLNRAAELKEGTLKEKYTEGLTNYHNQNYRQAISCFEQALDINPNYSPARNALGACKSRIFMKTHPGYNSDEGVFTLPLNDSIAGKIYDYFEGGNGGAPMVSVIISAGKYDDRLERCINRCLHFDYPIYEVLVLPDRPFERFERGFRVIPTGRVGGEVKRDIGAKEARGKILAFIDSDADPDRHWLKRRIDTIEESSLAAAGGVNVNPDTAEMTKNGGANGEFNWFLFKHGITSQSFGVPFWWDLIIRKQDFRGNVDFFYRGDTVEKLVRRNLSRQKKRGLKNTLMAPLYLLMANHARGIFSRQSICFARNGAGYYTVFKKVPQQKLSGVISPELNLGSSGAEAAVSV